MGKVSIRICSFDCAVTLIAPHNMDHFSLTPLSSIHEDNYSCYELLGSG